MSTSIASSRASSVSPRPRPAASREHRKPTSRSSRSTSVRRVDCRYLACGFIQDLCRNTIGPSAGELIVLRPFQHDILHGLFDRSGRPQHRYAYIGLPRKNGKSTLGAAIALYGLVALGGVIGEQGIQVYSCAGDRRQASIVFDEAKRMVLADPELRGIIRVQRWHLEGPQNSIYRVLSADATLQQGLNPALVIFDEVHVQPNRDLWDAMVLGMGIRSAPMIVGITTAGFDRTTLAWDLYERGKRGELYFWWQEPGNPSCDWHDESTWREANPALGDFLRLEALREDARVTPESSFRRYHLNQWTTTHSAWLPHGAWADIAAERVVSPKEPVVLFLDGSWANDSTAIVGCTVTDPYLFKVGLWTPDVGLGHIDMAAVENGLRAAVERFNVRQIGFDPRGFQDFFDRMEADGLPVVSWPTNSLDRMVPACEEFYRAVLGKRIHHEDDPDLASHLANAVLKEDRYGPRIVKETKTSQRKIDLAVCAVGSYDLARRFTPTPVGHFYAAGPDIHEPKRERSPEEELALVAKRLDNHDYFFGDDD